MRLPISLVLSSFAGLAAAQEEVLRTGEHFEVAADFDGAAEAEAALATAEAAYARAVALFGEPDRDGPMRLWLLRTVEEYRRVDERLTGGNFASNLAFTSFRTRAAYVAIQPPCDDGELERLGLSPLTRHQVAHEAAHVVCYNALPSYEFHPAWLAEGAATWVGEETLVANGWSQGLEEDPYTAKWILLAQGLLADGRLPNLHDVFEGRTGHLETYDRYAVWGLAFRFLHTRGGEPFARVLARARALSAGRTFRAELVRALREEFGEDYAGLDGRFHAWLAGLEPRWDETGRSLETAGPAWTQQAFGDQAARAWRIDSFGGGFVLDGLVEIVSSERGAGAEVLVGRAGDSALSVFLEADGQVILGRERADRGWSWRALTFGRTSEPLAGRRVPLRIEARPDRLSVTLGGELALSAPLAEEDSVESWGLGARAGTAVVWHDVRARPLAW